MKMRVKKPYEKPRMRRIGLDAKCAVLGFCKTNGTIGPGNPNCLPPGVCKKRGS